MMMKNKSCIVLLLIVFFFMLVSLDVSADQNDVSGSDFSSGVSFLVAVEDADFDDEDGFDDEFDEDLMEEFEDSAESVSIADPLYYVNYAMYFTNDFLYHAGIKPLATGYKKITPTFFRKGVNNFFHNLMFPVRFVNNLLQGQFRDAGSEVGIFAINTTIGVLGLGQVAQNKFDMYTADEDLGQTFGSYGIGNGFYLVLPFLGPSSLRDGVGLVGDYFITPLNYVEPWELSLGLKGFDTLNAASFRLGDYEALTGAAIDPYLAIRNAYIQYRDALIKE